MRKKLEALLNFPRKTNRRHVAIENAVSNGFDRCLSTAITETSPYKSDPRFPPGVGIKMIKMHYFQYFSIKSYFVDVY